LQQEDREFRAARQPSSTQLYPALPSTTQHYTAVQLYPTWTQPNATQL